MSMKKELTMKAVAEIFKLASRINIKPKDIIGMGGDIVKMGKSLFNTKVNPELTKFISDKGKIPTKIVEDIKIHLRSLKNASETQVELFKINLKDIVNAKFPPVTSVKQPGTSGKKLAPEAEVFDLTGKKIDTSKGIMGGFEIPFNEGGMAKLNAELNQLPEYYLPFADGGISNHFRKKFNKGELVDEVNGLMEKTPFFTQEDYDKVKYKDPKGKYSVEKWGKGEAPSAEATEDNEIISYMGKFVEGETEKNLDKAKVLAHEKLHLLWEDPEVRATAPPKVQEQFSKADKLWKKYEKSFDAGDDKKADAYYDEFDKTSSGVPLDPDKPTTGGGDVTGEELYTRFIENKYFPKKTESDEGPWGDRVHFDKTLKAQWDPYAKKFDTLMRSRQAHGGIANHFRIKKSAGGNIGGGVIEGTNLGARTGFAKIEMRGKAPKPKGLDSPLYKALDVKGKKIAMHVYGTLDISDRKRKRIHSGEITMNTKPITSWKTQAGEYISVKSKHGSNVIDGIDFPNEKMKQDFIKDLKLRAKQPVKAVYEYGNEWFAEKYPIKLRQVKRAIPYVMEKNKIKYLELEENSKLRNIRKRAEHLNVSSSELQEGRIIAAKTKILKEQNLARKIDFAHRTSKAHMVRLGLQFDTSLVGMDSRVINQVIIRPSEMKLDRLYTKQFKIFEQLKNNPTDELLKKQLVDINKQVKDVIKTTSGRLVGVTIDPHTLEASFEGVKKKYSLTKFIGENMTLKELEKLSPADQQKFLTKQLTNAVNAEVKKGFVPNDFKKILTNSKSREAILKYAKIKTPELIGKLKWAFKNPNSKVAMKVLSKLSLTEGFIIEDVLKKFAEGKTSMEAMASPLLLDKPVHQLLKRSKADDQQNWAYDRVNFLKYIKDGAATGSQLAQMANKDPDFDGKYTDYIEFLKAMAADPHQQKLIRERDIETEAELTLPAEKVAERSERYETWNKMPAVRAVKDYFKSDEQKEKVEVKDEWLNRGGLTGVDQYILDRYK